MQFSIENAISFSIGGAIGFLSRTIVDHFLASSRSRKDHEIKQFDDAANNFRKRVLAELEGLYPVTHVWPERVYPRFKQSLDRIENAAAEFRYFLKNESDFNVAVKEYREYCSEASSDRTVAWHLYNLTGDSGDISPEQKFQEIVQRLLSFAERK